MAFERAATYLSFSGAAENLGRTPSAVSHAVRNLEQFVGAKLFDRVGKSISLTTDGARYFEAVRPMLLELELATRALQQSHDANLVRISALPFFTSTVLLPNLGKFELRNPGMHLQIETSNSFADVRHGDFDIALRFGNDESKGLFCAPLVTVSGLPMAAPSYLERAQILEHPQDILRHTLIHVRPNLSAWEDWLHVNGIEIGEIKDGLVFDTILGALDAAVHGHGVALLMDPLIRSHASFGTQLVAPLANTKSDNQDYNFICQEAQWLEPKIQKTYNWLKECIRGLPTP